MGFVGDKTNAWLLAAVLALVLPAVAADQPGTIRLFNGRDLSGWDGPAGWWTVEDGALTAESTPAKVCRKANYLVWTGGQPSDYILECDFRISDKGNSGIHIRSQRRLDHDMFGYQADMTGDGKLIGYIYHHQYGLVAARGTRVVIPGEGERRVETNDGEAELLAHYKSGGWNHYRIVCKGESIVLYLNGVKMCDVTDRKVAGDARRGFIGLQMHPGPPMKVQFKNIFLTPLAPGAEATQSSTP